MLELQKIQQRRTKATCMEKAPHTFTMSAAAFKKFVSGRGKLVPRPILQPTTNTSPTLPSRFTSREPLPPIK